MRIPAKSISLTLALAGFACWGQTTPAKRNVVIFIADGLRPGSVNPTDTPAMYNIRTNGVNFSNSHALFPTFTTPNASAIATGHYLGDTGDFSNTISSGYPIFDTGLFGNSIGTVTPFLENNQVIADVNARYGYNFFTEQSLMALARANGYSTASVGKVGPAGMQDIAQVVAYGKQFNTPATIFIDDATGTVPGLPLSQDMINALTAAGISTTATARNQPSGNNTTPGTTMANLGQQQYFADAATKAILPLFKTRQAPFMLVFWSRDPDGTQHNQGDSLNKLTPGINGPTSIAGVHNADNNLKQILDYINSDPAVAANTDIFLTADHGFATISKYETDNAGGVTGSYAAKFTYKTSAGVQEVKSGFLPAGFLAIDVAHALNLPLFDPDSQVMNAKGVSSYMPVDPTVPQQTAAVRQRPAAGNGIIGGSGAILETTDATALVAANGGSDLIYVPSHDPATLQKIVTFLTTQDYVGGLFVNDIYGPIPGALSLSSINLKGNAATPTPDIAVNFKTFALDATNPLQTAVQIADSTLQEGQGMHGTLSRDNTFNNMAAIGPDFKSKYIDNAPISNADIVPTIAQILGLKLPSVGALQGRVISEALVGNPDAPAANKLTLESVPAASGKRTVLLYQQFGSQLYFDEARFLASGTQAVAGPKNAALTGREVQLDGTGSVSVDGGPLTYAWTQTSGQTAAVLRPNTATPFVQLPGHGKYVFQLAVTDQAGYTSTDTVTLQY